MAFDEKQIRQLKARLRPHRIKSRIQDGVTLRYLEGWQVIAEANRIFGFDSWDRKTVDVQCVYTKHIGSRYEAVYIMRVRIIVNADGQTIIREGSGSGEASASTPGEAHEFALKAAETDATKRALMTFGSTFGLSLYKAGKMNPAPSGKRPEKASGHPGPSKNTATPDALPITGKPNNQPPHLNGATRIDKAQKPNPISKPLTRSKTPIDKSVLAICEPKRLRDPDHLKFVATRRCIVCGRNRTQAHHVTFAQPNALGRKVSDEFTVPLCSNHHQELHQSGNEREWWLKQGIEPLSIAKDMWEDNKR